jgi:hypothetical protein
VRDKREAVGRTISLIARTLDETPKDIQLNLADYWKYIA